MQVVQCKVWYGLLLMSLLFGVVNCSKKSSPAPSPLPPSPLILTAATIDNKPVSASGNYQVANSPVIRLRFNQPVNRSTAIGAITLQQAGTTTALTINYENKDSTLTITPASPLPYLTRYTILANANLQSVQKTTLSANWQTVFVTQLDTTDKFPRISDDALLTLVQQQTFRYFWDYGHPVSGLARERSNATHETITSGGSGFGIMAIPVAVNRGFITRTQGLSRMQTIVGFLKNTAQKFHGAFSHWLNGSTGTVIPFSQKDDGADIVETAYLVAGLLCARQYFNGTDATETSLRNDINTICNGVEWNWFRKSSENVLYWHWSANYGWEMNHKIQGWNECLITYILAASSTTYSIPKLVYSEGFARNGAMVNGNNYYGLSLPLGPAMGGPLFWAHYSFMGINPYGLSDAYANYQTQVVNHTKVNYEYCRVNPKNFTAYGSNCWGLTASDVPNGYAANEPANDMGVIAPTAALSSMPYTPEESMAALRFFYYKLGDKIWTNYGFADAFSLQEPWVASSHLAIDQGPIVVMIENHRSKLIWNLLTSCPEIKNGMKNVLGFTAPYL